MDTGGHQARDMGHINHEAGANFIGYLTEPLVVNDSGIGTGAGDDQFGSMLSRQFGDIVIVQSFGLLADAVGYDLVDHPGEIDRTTHGKMPPMGQVHTQIGIPRFKDGQIDRHIRLGTRMGLHVRMVCTEDLLGPRDSQVLDYVVILTPPVIPASWISFRILVGHHRALGLEDRFTHCVF